MVLTFFSFFLFSLLRVFFRRRKTKSRSTHNPHPMCLSPFAISFLLCNRNSLIQRYNFPFLLTVDVHENVKKKKSFPSMLENEIKKNSEQHMIMSSVNLYYVVFWLYFCFRLLSSCPFY